MMLKTWLVEPKRWRLLLVCGFLGAMAFLLLYGVRTLNVTDDRWIYPGIPEADIVQNYSGWMAYRLSDWAFPLGYFNRICWPDGTMLSYLDTSVPLSVLFKLLSPLLPATFQYYGWYTLLCFVLQGVAAGMLLVFWLEKAWQVYLTVPLFCFSPILIERAFRHTQLATHFIILLALYYYIRSRREGWRRVPWQFVGLNALAVVTHPYFLPMVMALLFATLVEYVMVRKSAWKPLGALALSGAAVLATGWAMGLFGWAGSSLSRDGFGFYSMNINAPFNPSSLGAYRWSILLGSHTQQPGQYDGFNYLGLGVLFFLGLAAVHWLVRCAGGPEGFFRACGRSLLGQLRRFWVLLAVCAALTLFALSNTIVLHEAVLLRLPLPQPVLYLCNIFRASSRLFYPVYYVIFMWLARYLALHFKDRVRVLLLTAMVVLQLGDLSAVAVQKHRYYASPPAPASVLSDEALVAACAGRDKLILLDFDWVDYSYMALAASNGMRTNIYSVNSGSYPGAAQVGHDALTALLGGRIEPDTVYLATLPETMESLQAALSEKGVVFYKFNEAMFIFTR